MTDEEKKQGQGDPAPASGDKPEGETPAIPETPATPDYKAEAEQKSKELMGKEDQLRKAGFTIQKLKDKMKEEGIEPEEGQGLSEEQVESIVSKVIGEKLGEISKDNQALKNTMSEVLKSISSKENKSKGGGEGGQDLPKEEGTPRPKNLSPDEEKVVEGMDWDSKRAGWVDRTTKAFYPHERKTASSAEGK